MTTPQTDECGSVGQSGAVSLVDTALIVIGARSSRYRTLTLAAIVVAGACALSGCGSNAAAFCDTSAHGSTARAAIRSYLRDCGSDYSIEKGPYDADKSTTAYASYSQVVEYTLNVKDNKEGPVAFLMVGQRLTGGTWHTLSPPGTGP
jgi:hypothetical protein